MDILILKENSLPACFSLLPVGFLFGLYWEYIQNYGAKNVKIVHWYALVSIGISVVIGAVLTVKKCRDRRYKFDHFYVIFYGMICYVISACFVISNHEGRCNFFPVLRYVIWHLTEYCFEIDFELHIQYFALVVCVYWFYVTPLEIVLLKS